MTKKKVLLALLLPIIMTIVVAGFLIFPPHVTFLFFHSRGISSYHNKACTCIQRRR